MEPFLERAHRRARTGTWLWRIGAITAIVAAIFFLGACALIPLGLSLPYASNTPGPNPAEHLPDEVGSCWNSDDPAALATETWVDGAVGPCSAPHTVLTVAVVLVPDVSTNPPLGVFDSGAASDDEFGNDAYSRTAVAMCAQALKGELPFRTSRQQLLHPLVGLPGRADWNAGARWARCDLTAFQVGSPRRAALFASMPNTVEELWEQTEQEWSVYDLCLDPVGDPGPAGPGSDVEATLVSCDAQPRWRLLSIDELHFRDDPPRPSGDAIDVLAEELCDASIRDSGFHSVEQWVYRPSEAQWATEPHLAYCWVGQVT